MDDAVTISRLAPDTDDRFQLLRRELGVTAFGLNLIALPPGGRGRIHRHERQEEVYLVLEGVLDLMLDDGVRELRPGELARVGPEARRQLVNRGPGRLQVLAMGAAGEHRGRDGVAFSGWDDREGGSPQEIPLPKDLPAAELRAAG